MSFPARCDHCSHALPPGVRYCPKCGAVVSVHTPTGEAPARVPAFLVIRIPGGVVRKDVLSTPIVRIGRARSCEVAIDHPQVSRIHALLEIRDGAWHLSDAKSAGGTFWDERPIHEPVELRSGANLRLGRIPEEGVAIVFHLGG